MHFLSWPMWGLPFCYLFSSQNENEEGWWSVLCGLNNYLKTTAAADGHTYTNRDTHSEKPLKHLTLHLTSSGVKSFYWLSIFSPRPVQTNGLFVYGSAFVTVSIYCRLERPHPVWGCVQVCIWVIVECMFSVCVYVGLLTKRKCFLIVFLC